MRRAAAIALVLAGCASDGSPLFKKQRPPDAPFDAAADAATGDASPPDASPPDARPADATVDAT